MLKSLLPLFLVSSAAVPRRPTLAVRGEVITMRVSLRDSTPSSMAGLLLLLLLPTVFSQMTLSFEPLTQPECSKREHPKVSIHGQTSCSSSNHYLQVAKTSGSLLAGCSECLKLRPLYVSGWLTSRFLIWMFCAVSPPRMKRAAASYVPEVSISINHY